MFPAFSQATTVWGLKQVLKFAEVQTKEMNHGERKHVGAVFLGFFGQFLPTHSIRKKMDKNGWPLKLIST